MKLSYLIQKLKNYDDNKSFLDRLKKEDKKITELRTYLNTVDKTNEERELKLEETYELWKLAIHASPKLSEIKSECEYASSPYHLFSNLYDELGKEFDFERYCPELLESCDLFTFENYKALLTKMMHHTFDVVSVLKQSDLIHPTNPFKQINFDAAIPLTHSAVQLMRSLGHAEILNKANFDLLCQLDKAKPFDLYDLLRELSQTKTLDQAKFDYLIQNLNFAIRMKRNHFLSCIFVLGSRIALQQPPQNIDSSTIYVYSKDNKIMFSHMGTYNNNHVDITSQLGTHADAIKEAFKQNNLNLIQYKMITNILEDYHHQIRKDLDQTAYDILYMQFPKLICDEMKKLIASKKNPEAYLTAIRNGNLASTLEAKELNVLSDSIYKKFEPLFETITKIEKGDYVYNTAYPRHHDFKEFVSNFVFYSDVPGLKNITIEDIKNIQQQNKSQSGSSSWFSFLSGNRNNNNNTNATYDSPKPR